MGLRNAATAPADAAVTRAAAAAAAATLACVTEEDCSSTDSSPRMVRVLPVPAAEAARGREGNKWIGEQPIQSDLRTKLC
jgi:hypothetical protein